MEGFDRQQGVSAARWCGMVAVGVLVEVVAAVARAGHLRQLGAALRLQATEDGRAGHAVLFHELRDARVGRPSEAGFSRTRRETKIVVVGAVRWHAG